MMIRVLTVAVSLGLASTHLKAQEPGPDFIPIVMMVGCIEDDGRGRFSLTQATEPVALDDRVPDEPAPTVPLGDETVRLVGTLDEFGVPNHTGHKVRVKGLYVDGDDENRLNLTSILMLAEACQ